MCLTALLSLTSYNCRVVSDEQPNIVFFLLDDLGWHDTGFAGDLFYETPNLDRLAREGMVFTQAYANGPNCAPTRASILSGQYPPRHGIYTVGSPERGRSAERRLIPAFNRADLAGSCITVAETLRKAGYRTAHIGKWHLGAQDTGPIAQGFDVNKGGNRIGHPSNYFSPYGNPDLADGHPGEYLTDRLTEEALRFIENNQRQPFFLYLAHYAVHTPIQAPDMIVDRFRTKRSAAEPDKSSRLPNPIYAAMIQSVDAGIGRIAARLVELHLDRKTVIVFFSDNGGLLGVTDNRPLRGGKGMLYEGGIREPMFIRWPGKIEPGTRCDEPVMGIDFYPTLQELAGVPALEGHHLDGQSLLPLLLRQPGWADRPLFWHFPAYLEGNPDNSEGSHRPGWRTTPCAAVREGDWKLIEYFEDGAVELYNLARDIGEQDDLADAEPGRRAHLARILKDWQKSVRAPIPNVPNPEFSKK